MPGALKSACPHVLAACCVLRGACSRRAILIQCSYTGLTVHRDTPNRCAIRLREVQAAACLQGGRCLSDNYETLQTRMEFECAEGHRWETTAVIVLDGSWCPACRYRPLSRVAQMQEVAREHGGWCLSNEYVAELPGMRWRCARGHEWNAVPKRLRRGSWCPTCAQNQPYTLADMQALAAKHGGTCVSREYLGQDTLLQWACAHGHRFSVRPRCVNRGQWCSECLRADGSWARALAFAQMQGGACLARGRKVGNVSVRWRCASGHQWTASAYRVARGTWCPRCAGRRLGIEHMQAYAASRDGRCVSPEYLGGDTKLLWECERGHRWWARPAGMRQRSHWCPECAWDQKSETMRSEAKDRR